MDASALPAWAQVAGAIGIVITATLGAIFNYTKTKEKVDPSSSSTGTVVSASFVDSKLIKELIDTVRDHQDEQLRDSKKTHRALQDLREAVVDNTEALIVETDSTTNLLKFMTRNLRRANEDTE